MNSGQMNSGTNRLLNGLDRQRAIAMEDFSWPECRWPGAGCENGSVALDELAERGQDAVRIDAYPHLLGRGATREWALTPAWAVHDRGAPDLLRTTIQPQLNTIPALCRERGILVGLSRWFRTDGHDVRRYLVTPEQHAGIWLSALETVRSAGLTDRIRTGKLPEGCG